MTMAETSEEKQTKNRGRVVQRDGIVQAIINIHGKEYFLGNYGTPELAQKAIDGWKPGK